MRPLVFAAALLFIVALGLLTVLYIKNTGLTVGAVVGIILVVFCAVGVVGALLHPPDR